MFKVWKPYKGSKLTDGDGNTLDVQSQNVGLIRPEDLQPLFISIGNLISEISKLGTIPKEEFETISQKMFLIISYIGNNSIAVSKEASKIMEAISNDHEVNEDGKEEQS